MKVGSGGISTPSNSDQILSKIPMTQIGCFKGPSALLGSSTLPSCGPLLAAVGCQLHHHGRTAVQKLQALKSWLLPLQDTCKGPGVFVNVLQSRACLVCCVSFVFGFSSYSAFFVKVWGVVWWQLHKRFRVVWGRSQNTWRPIDGFPTLLWHPRSNPRRSKLSPPSLRFCSQAWQSCWCR